MTDRKKNPGTWDSTAPSNAVYKRSWSEKVQAEFPDSQKSGSKAGKAFAAVAVKDLRPLRGALRASLTAILASAPSQLWGADAPPFLKKGDNDKMNPTSTKMPFLFDRSHPLRK